MSTQGLDLYDIANFVFGTKANNHQTPQLPQSNPLQQSTPYESEPAERVHDLGLKNKEQYFESNPNFQERQSLPPSIINRSNSYSKSFSEEASTTSVPRLEKELSYNSSLSSIPVSELPSQLDFFDQSAQDMTYQFPPRTGSRHSNHHQPYVDTVSSMSQIKTVPNMPSSASIDSPTPSRHPELSRGSSFYAPKNRSSQKLKTKIYNDENYEPDQHISNNYERSYSTYHSQGNTLQGRDQNASNVAVYDDTRGSQYRAQDAVPIHHPLPRAPVQPAVYKLSDYYDPGEDEELHEIPIQQEDVQLSQYDRVEREVEEINPEMKKYIDAMVEQLGKKFEDLKTRRAASLRVSPPTNSFRKHQSGSFVELTPIQDGTLYLRGQSLGPDVIPSPNLSNSAMKPVYQSQAQEKLVEDTSSARELFKLKQFLKDMPNGEKLLESYEQRETVNQDEPVNHTPSIFETPQSHGLGIRDTQISNRTTNGSNRKAGSLEVPIPYQSTPIDVEKRRVSSVQPRRLEINAQSRLRSEGPRNTVSFSEDPPKIISSDPIPGNIESRARSGTSSSTLNGSASAGSTEGDNVDAGLFKLLSHLTEKDAKIAQMAEDLASTNKELEAAKKYITKLRGIGKPIVPAIMPDARKQGVPEHRKLYNKLEMSSVDKLGNTELRNLVKNILLMLGIPLSQLPNKLKVITEVLQQEYIYVQFANDVHHSLYSKDMDLQDPYGEHASVCLTNMLALVRQLDSDTS